jgi:hypothetical protein
VLVVPPLLLLTRQLALVGLERRQGGHRRWQRTTALSHTHTYVHQPAKGGEVSVSEE